MTERELEVVEMLIDVGTGKKVAKRLGITEQTVKNHLMSVREKTETDTTVQAIYKLITGG